MNQGRSGRPALRSVRNRFDPKPPPRGTRTLQYQDLQALTEFVKESVVTKSVPLGELNGSAAEAADTAVNASGRRWVPPPARAFSLIPNGFRRPAGGR